MILDRHSILAHTAYDDLLRSLRDEAVSDIRGTPTRVVRNERVYWYDSYRIGSDVRKSYLGEDSDELRERLDLLARLRAGREDRRRHRSRLIRILRAEGFAGVNAAAGSFMAALAGGGTFRLGGTIIGTHAFRLYEGELGLCFDLNIGNSEHLSLALADVGCEPLKKVLADFAFEPVPALEEGKVWRWRQTRNQFLVELLTPSFNDKEGWAAVAAGVEVRSERFLWYLLAEPILAAVPYRSGVLVQIPRPERFAIYNLLVASDRGGRASQNARAGLQQAALIIHALLEDRPDDLADAYRAARACGPYWCYRLDASLARLPTTHYVLEGLKG